MIRIFDCDTDTYEDVPSSMKTVMAEFKSLGYSIDNSGENLMVSNGDQTFELIKE